MASWSDTATPGEAREQWHRNAAERAAARLADGPDDDTETDDSPWRDAGEPVFRLRDEFEPESYWPYEYVRAALPVLDGFGWLNRPAMREDEDAAVAVLGGLDDLSLDQTDVFPFGLLWSLRARGVLGEVAGLDEQLVGWRKWEEEDHLAHGDCGPDPLAFLPVLNPSDEWAESVLRHERERVELDLRQTEELLALAGSLGYEIRTLQAKANAARARLGRTAR